MGLGLENPLHLAIVLIVVLMVFGAKRVPEIGRSLGEGIRTFKNSVTGATDGVKIAEIEAPRPPAQADDAQRTRTQQTG